VGRIRQKEGSWVRYKYPDDSIRHGKIVERVRIVGTRDKHYRAYFDKIKWKEDGKITYRLVYYYRNKKKSKRAWVFGQRHPDFPKGLWINLLDQIKASGILNRSQP